MSDLPEVNRRTEAAEEALPTETETLHEQDAELEQPSTPRARRADDHSESESSPSTRRRITLSSPKREAPVEVEEAKSKHLRISAVLPDTCVTTLQMCSVQFKTGLDVPIHVNQDEKELEFELMAKEHLFGMTPSFLMRKQYLAA